MRKIDLNPFRDLSISNKSKSRSMSLYQFLIAVRQQDGQQLTNDAGEITSHLIGIFYRTLKIVESGMKPVYVFDGAPPEMKGGELAKRLEQRNKALESAEQLKETGTAEEVSKFERRTVRVTKEHNTEAKRLLKLMGIPYVEAPGEAEAQCAALAKAKKVFAAASEDMDTLTFGSTTLLRHLTASESKGLPITEIDLPTVLKSLELSQDEFIDLCILLGCDYCDSIRGVGPATALKLIKEHRTLEKVVESIVAGKLTKYRIPEHWPYAEARKLFQTPDVLDSATVDLKWENPDVDGLIQFLVTEKGFAEDRVRKGAAKLKRENKSAAQGRLDDFFKIMPKAGQDLKNANKRKKEALLAEKSKKARVGGRRR